MTQTRSSPEKRGRFNYKKDGIEGYVFPTSYANAPVAEQLIFCNWSSADLFGVGNQAFMAR